MKTIFLFGFIFTINITMGLDSYLSLAYSNQITNDKDFKFRNGLRISFDLINKRNQYSIFFNSSFSNKVLTLNKKEKYGGGEYQKNVKTWMQNLTFVYSAETPEHEKYIFSNGLGFGMSLFHDNVNIASPRINLNYQFEFVRKDLIKKDVSIFVNLNAVVFSPPLPIHDVNQALQSTFIMFNSNIGLKYIISKSQK